MVQTQNTQGETLSESECRPAQGNEVQDLFTRLSAACDTSTFSFMDKSPFDLVQSTASFIVNQSGSWDKVFANLVNLNNQGKLPELQSYFSNSFSTDAVTTLAGNFPAHSAEICRLFGRSTDQASTTNSPKDPMLGGLSREQLAEIHKKFPALEGVIKPEVLGAMIQNESDHTDWKDTLSEFPLKSLAWLHRKFDVSDGTDLASSLNIEELRDKVKNSEGRPWYERWGNKAELKFKETILELSIGDAQMQVRNILALQEQERAAGRDVPKISTAFTAEGSANLVGAYFTKSIELLSNNQATNPEKNPFLDTSRPSVVKGFEEAQRLWNLGDPASRQRAVMLTYNAGVNRNDPNAWTPERILKHYLGR